jgi:hypothetical protein
MDTHTIEKLAQARADEAEHRAIMKNLKEDFEQSFAYRVASENIEKCTATTQEAENDFQREALENFRIDGNKKKDCYEIKINKFVILPNVLAAFEWCMKNYTVALSLNIKSFEKAALAGQIPASLAEVKEAPKVYVKSDLSEWLKKE